MEILKSKKKWNVILELKHNIIKLSSWTKIN